MVATEIVLQGELNITLVQALLGIVSVIAIAAFGYIMGRIGTLDEKLTNLNEIVVDLHQRMYGREHDRTDRGGFLAEVRDEFDAIHTRLDKVFERLDHDRRERSKDRREINRRLETIQRDGGHRPPTRRHRPPHGRGRSHGYGYGYGRANARGRQGGPDYYDESDDYDKSDAPDDEDDEDGDRDHDSTAGDGYDAP